MRIRSVSRTHVGLQRDNNEDSFLTLPDFDVYAVADGMGGHAAGEVASRIAIQAVESLAGTIRHYTHFANRHGIGDNAVRDVLRNAFKGANDRILADADRNWSWSQMGTTLTACAVLDGTLHVGHAGDSACYLLRDGTARKLTEDHATGHVLRNCLGVRPDAFKGMAYYRHALLRGDVVLLATDGLTDCADEKQVARIAAAGRFDGFADRLIEHALAAGGRDNATVVAIEIT